MVGLLPNIPPYCIPRMYSPFAGRIENTSNICSILFKRLEHEKLSELMIVSQMMTFQAMNKGIGGISSVVPLTVLSISFEG